MSYQGELSIGDEWQAIRLIAASQVNPRKAVAELIENSIDAEAKHIVVVRGKIGRNVFLRILDDGRGAAHSEHEGKVVVSDDIEANLKRIGEGICDSIKRKLEARHGVMGEFGIGILGFWAVGNTFEFRSRTARSDTYVLTMEREKRDFTVEKSTKPLEKAGTEVIIKGLHDTVRHVLSGQRLANYLAQELRGRLLEFGTQIHIVDALLGGGKIPVRPMDFLGEPLSDLTELPTRSGRVANLELYMNFGASSSEPAEVGLYRKGTRLVANVTALDDFQHEPWTLNILEGKIEYPFLSTSPGTRTGVLTNEDFEELVLGLKDIEPIISKRIKARQKDLREERTSGYMEFLKNAFRKVFKDLPAEYDFFKGPEVTPPPRPVIGPLAKVEIVPDSVAIVSGCAWRFTAEPMDENDYAVREGVTFLWKLSPEIAKVCDSEKKSCEVVAGNKPGEAVLAVEVRQEKRTARSTAKLRVVEQCGELSNVSVLPRVAVVWPGHSRNLTAICTDHEGIHVPSVTVHWLCSPTHGTFSSTAGLRATFQAKSDAPQGPVPIKVIAKARNKQLDGSATLYLYPPRRLGEKFPPYIFWPEPLSPWRSKWVSDGYQLRVNSEHQDYKRAKEARTDLEYIAMLYSKELVLINFGQTAPPSEILERLVEVQSRLFPPLLAELKG